MLRSLRSPDGGPALRVRVVAGLVLLGMVVLVAPAVLMPVVGWLIGMVL